MVQNRPKKPVVHPGFPRWGAPTPKMEMEAKTCYLERFFRKRHENERNWTNGGGERVPSPPPRSANGNKRKMQVGDALGTNKN